MSEFCSNCGKPFGNGPRIPIQNGIEWCEMCWCLHEKNATPEKESFAIPDATETYSSTSDKNNIDSIKSQPNIWVKYLKLLCYIEWGGMTLLGFIIGAMMADGAYSDETTTFMYTIFGGIIGFILGFSLIAINMLFISLAEEVSIMNKNTAKILEILKK